MIKDFSNLNLTEVEAKKLTIILPNTAYGCHWGILEKDQDFMDSKDLIELKDGYLVLQGRGILLNALYHFKRELPKRMLEFFSKEYEKSLKRILYDLKDFTGGKIAIFSNSSALIAFHNDEQIPCYAIDFESLKAICKKYGLCFVLAGKKIPLDVFNSDEKVNLFLKGCELSGSGDSVVVELIKS